MPLHVEAITVNMPDMVGYSKCIETWEKFNFIFHCCIDLPVIATVEAVKATGQAIFGHNRIK